MRAVEWLSYFLSSERLSLALSQLQLSLRLNAISCYKLENDKQ